MQVFNLILLFIKIYLNEKILNSIKKINSHMQYNHLQDYF